MLYMTWGAETRSMMKEEEEKLRTEQRAVEKWWVNINYNDRISGRRDKK